MSDSVTNSISGVTIQPRNWMLGRSKRQLLELVAKGPASTADLLIDITADPLRAALVGQLADHGHRNLLDDFAPELVMAPGDDQALPAQQ
jgi:hypothetical protein